MIRAKERPSHPHASGWSISGGSGASENELRRQIRTRLSEARLPAVDGVWKSQPGTGRPCIVCRRPIEPIQVERQVDGVGIALIAHEACYTLCVKDQTSLPNRSLRSNGDGLFY